MPPDDAHEWLALMDESGDRWLFDVSFLDSGFGCIWGSGCPSTEPVPDPTGVIGCCAHGAYLTDDEDEASVLAAAARLEPEIWQHHPSATDGPIRSHPDGSKSTRLADGACVFLNRDGFAGGAGCALHIGATKAKEEPLSWKPDVCWQVPLRLEVHTDENGRDTVILRAWDRADWGEGGSEFGWWCTESAEAYRSPEPLYRTMSAEIAELVGPEMYQRLADHLDQRAATPVTMGATR